MIEKIKENLDLVAQFQTDSNEEIEAFRIKYLSKSSKLIFLTNQYMEYHSGSHYSQMNHVLINTLVF